MESVTIFFQSWLPVIRWKKLAHTNLDTFEAGQRYCKPWIFKIRLIGADS